MPDHHHRLAIETGQATDDRVVVGKSTITMQFFKIGKNQRQVIKRVGALRVAGDLGNLPRGELGVDILGQLGALFFQTFNIFRDINSGIILDEAQLFDFSFEVSNGLLEVEETCFHGRLIFLIRRVF